MNIYVMEVTSKQTASCGVNEAGSYVREEILAVNNQVRVILQKQQIPSRRTPSETL